jgi:ferredoxin
MGHLIGKDIIYQKLGGKIDDLTMKTPWNNTFYNILKALYSHEEAEIIVMMPYGFSNFEHIQKVTKYDKAKLQHLLANLCSKGLILDLWICNEFYYMPSPIVIGIFEFTMMRTANNLKSEEWAKLFHEYMQGDGSLYAANFGQDERISFARALPHEQALESSVYVEILDYEKVSALVEEADRFAIGLCSCRHEKLHNHDKKCDVPLETCSSFGWAADYIIRNNFGKEVSKSEMLDNLARSKEMGLVLSADNVQKHITYICQCCGCCCNILLGVSKFGYANTIVTSSYMAEVDNKYCSACGKCQNTCPINAIEMGETKNIDSNKHKYPVIDTSLCLGCGVCVLKCPTKALKLIKRKQRVIHPETTFERIILQSLERGNLQNQLFDNPQNISQKVARGILGAFFRLSPIKKALMSDTLRSTFLKSIKKGAVMKGKGWLVRKNYRGGKRQKRRKFWEPR